MYRETDHRRRGVFGVPGFLFFWCFLAHPGTAGAADNPCGTVSIRPGPDSGKDAWVMRNDPNKNHGSHDRLALRGPASVGDAKYLYMEYPIPADAKKVELTLHQHDMDRAAVVEIREVIDPWDESTITFNNRPAVQVTPFATFAVQPGSGRTYTVDLTAGAVPGQDLAIEMSIDRRWGSFYSSDHSDPSLRPRLVVTRFPSVVRPRNDSWVHRNDPNANYGSDAGLGLRGPSGVFDEKHALLEFEVPQDAAEAVLVLSQRDMNRTTTVDVHRITGGWDEATVTWNNRPGVEPVPFTSFPVQPGASQYKVDVTAAMVPGQPLGLELRIASRWGSFYSNDYAVNPALRPRLEVTRLPARLIEFGPRSGNDAWIHRAEPAVNYGRHERLALRGPSGVFDEKRILMDLPIPADAFTVSLLLSQHDMDRAGTVSVYGVRGSWSETSVTWNTRPAVSSTPFTSFAVDPLASRYSVDLTAAAVPGQGLGIEMGIGGRWGSFYSTDHPDRSVRPQLLVTCLPTRTVQPDAQNGKDAWVQRDAPTTNHGTNPLLGLRGPDGVFDEKRALLEFDIPADAVTVRLVLSQHDMDRATVVHVYEVTGTWAESSVTWNNQPGVGSAPVASFAVAPGTAQYEIDLTSVAVPGQPMSLELTIADRWGAFYSSDHADASLRPKLEITHFCGRPVAVPFVRGDANSSNDVDLSDSIFVLSFLFTGGDKPGCMKSADVNDSGAVDLSDAVYLLGHLFLGEAPPPRPYPGCDADPTPDPLSCETRCGR